MKEPWQIHIQRMFMGFLAGIVATAARFYSIGTDTKVAFFTQHQGDDFYVYLYAYASGVLTLGFLGAVGAWIVKETDWRKMFWVGLSAPALFAAALSDHKEVKSSQTPIRNSMLEFVMPITPAYAAQDDDCVGDIALVKGVKLFLGVSDDRPDKYTVAVGSYKDRSVAIGKARSMNASDPTLKARVGKRACSSDYYPVIVGDPAPLDSAKKLLEKANDAASIGDGFLIPGVR